MVVPPMVLRMDVTTALAVWCLIMVSLVHRAPMDLKLNITAADSVQVDFLVLEALIVPNAQMDCSQMLVPQLVWLVLMALHPMRTRMAVTLSPWWDLVIRTTTGTTRATGTSILNPPNLEPKVTSTNRLSLPSRRSQPNLTNLSLT